MFSSSRNTRTGNRKIPAGSWPRIARNFILQTLERRPRWQSLGGCGSDFSAQGARSTWETQPLATQGVTTASTQGGAPAGRTSRKEEGLAARDQGELPLPAGANRMLGGCVCLQPEHRYLDVTDGKRAMGRGRGDITDDLRSENTGLDSSTRVIAGTYPTGGPWLRAVNL